MKKTFDFIILLCLSHFHIFPISLSILYRKNLKMFVNEKLLFLFVSVPPLLRPQLNGPDDDQNLSIFSTFLFCYEYYIIIHFVSIIFNHFMLPCMRNISAQQFTKENLLSTCNQHSPIKWLSIEFILIGKTFLTAYSNTPILKQHQKC